MEGRIVKRNESHSTLMLIVCMLPVLLFLLLALVGIQISPLLVPLILILCCLAMFWLMAGCHPHRHAAHPAEVAASAPESSEERRIDLPATVAARTRRRVGNAVIVEAELREPTEEAYESLRRHFSGRDQVPLLDQDEDGRPTVVLLPRAALEPGGRDSSPILHLVLFLATIATTTWAGALHQDVDLLKEPSRFAVGLPYSLALLVILGAHELGHYFAARAHGMRVSLPYFIPVPFGLGTFGAFIRLKSPAESRRALFDMAVAGPLAGLIFAIPALFIGLQHSQIVTTAQSPVSLHHGATVASSLLLTTVAKVAMGDALREGHVLMLHPLAFAGWLGLLVTALNLLPIGQLDGGHIADAMFGSRTSASISRAAVFALFILGIFVWSGLLTWAFIVYFIAGRKGLPPLNNITRLTPARAAVGWVAYLLLFTILTPVPHRLYEALGIHCPYV